MWSIPLNTVWVPFFTAMKVTGESAIADEALGAPLRLATEKDGTPRFNTKGLPVLRVAKELADQVRVIRDNFTLSLKAYTGSVQKKNKDGYKAQIEAARKAAETPSDTGQPC